jgi:hypothetical protein
VAECRRIDRLLQAYVDTEISDSERIIVEEHMSECASCRKLFERHRRTSAQLYDVFSRVRLNTCLRDRVLENLPELPQRSMDLASVNWRVKHPALTWRDYVMRTIPVAVAVVLVASLVIINTKWPQKEVPFGARVGVVTYLDGAANRFQQEDPKAQGIVTGDYVAAGSRFVVNGGAALMVALRGSTHVTMQENTRLLVEDARTVRLESGAAYFDVGHDGRWFKVGTPSGLVTVFGTKFNVAIDGPQTTVTVVDGEVQVDQGSAFCALQAGEQVSVNTRRKQNGMRPRRVNVEPIVYWARHLSPDSSALARFAALDKSGAEGARIVGIHQTGFRLDLGKADRTLDRFFLEWERTDGALAPADLRVYFSDSLGEPLFYQDIDAAPLRGTRGMSEIQLDSPIRGEREIFVRVVPQPIEGATPLIITGLSAE